MLQPDLAVAGPASFTLVVHAALVTIARDATVCACWTCVLNSFDVQDQFFLAFIITMCILHLATAAAAAVATKFLLTFLPPVLAA